MAITDYASLKVSVATFMQRSDLTAVIPDFISLAENRINGDLDARLQDTKASLSTTASVETVALPADVINVRHASIEQDYITTLVYMTPDKLEAKYSVSANGRPINYTIVGSNLYLRPIPDAIYTLDVLYKAKVAALSDTITTNFLLTNYPMVYLSAAMCVGAAYTKDKMMRDSWESEYQEAINSVNTQDWYSGSTMIVRSNTY